MTKQSLFRVLPLNLQQFAADTGADGGGGSADAGSAAPAAGSDGGGQFGGWGGVPSEVPNPLLGGEFGADPNAIGVPTGANPLETIDFGGRQVPVVDPTIKDLHGDWTELNRSFQSERQRAQQLESQVQQYAQMMQTIQQMQQQPVQQQQAPAAPAQPSAERLTEINDEYWRLAYDNKLQADAWLQGQPEYQQMVGSQFQSQVEQYVQQNIMPMVEPIVKERQYSQQLQQLAQKYPDLEQHSNTMSQMVQTNPALVDQLGLEGLFLLARGATYQPQQPMTPDALLQDPNFRNQILSNEQVKNEIIKSYVQQRQQFNQQVPPVMGTQPGGSMPALPENEPTTLREGSKLFMKALGLSK